jgi:fluoride exporter
MAVRLPLRPLTVAAGGVVGSWLRWGAASAFPVASGTFPVTTFAINLVGAALLGIALVALLDVPRPRTHWHALLGTGVLGAFTTFSTLVVEAVELGRIGRWPVAVAYVVASLAAGLAAVLATLTLTRRVLGLTREVS